MSTFLLELSYLVGSITFILGLKRLSSPDKARNGNLLAAAGMGLAILGTLLFHKSEAGAPIGNIPWIIGAMAFGTVIGYLMAMRVKMTAMPQMVFFFQWHGGRLRGIDFLDRIWRTPRRNHARFSAHRILGFDHRCRILQRQYCGLWKVG